MESIMVTIHKEGDNLVIRSKLSPRYALLAAGEDSKWLLCGQDETVHGIANSVREAYKWVA